MEADLAHANPAIASNTSAVDAPMRNFHFSYAQKLGVHIFSQIAYYAYALEFFIYFPLFILDWQFNALGFKFPPQTLDGGPIASDIIINDDATKTRPHLITNVMINLFLFLMFGLQHSIMARPAFKHWLLNTFFTSRKSSAGRQPEQAPVSRIIGEVVQRPLFTVCSSLAFGLLLYLWRPIPVEIFRIDNKYGIALLYATCALSAALLLVCEQVLESRLDLSGYGQAAAFYKKGEIPKRTNKDNRQFTTSFLYAYVQHPTYTFVLALMWTISRRMTIGRLLFLTCTTLYVLIGSHFEERDLARTFGKRYEDYRQKVPRFIFIPFVHTPYHVSHDDG